MLFCEFSSAQQFKDAYVSPGLSLGYCLTSHGLFFGINCDVGLKKTIKNSEPLNYGFSFCKSWTGVVQANERYVHRHTTINFLVESKIIDFKVGYGVAKNPSGYLNIRKCRVGGLNLDLSLTKPNYPWIGIKSFYYKRKDWRWFDKPYYTMYLKYEYDFHHSGLRND